MLCSIHEAVGFFLLPFACCGFIDSAGVVIHDSVIDEDFNLVWFVNFQVPTKCILCCFPPYKASGW